jgi:hypothetical protein
MGGPHLLLQLLLLQQQRHHQLPCRCSDFHLLLLQLMFPLLHRWQEGCCLHCPLLFEKLSQHLPVRLLLLAGLRLAVAVSP